jgi:hypothetical protein
MRWLQFCFLAFLLCINTIGHAEETNYCRDEAAEAQWLILLAENPNDLNLQALHAIRTGLCIKVDRGMLSLEDATKIFESGRSALIEKWGMEEEEKEIPNGEV